MQQKERAQHFASLHVPGKPLILYNAWDAGSARAIARAGFQATGTSSWAIAAAHGYSDGESIPLTFMEEITAHIVRTVDLPVSVDTEGGYSIDPLACAKNIARFVDRGVVGINFEDRVLVGTGLHEIDAQCERIAAIRNMADARGIPLFINARTDVFLERDIVLAEGLDEACRRAAAYTQAGASGFFVPGLVDLDAISQLCKVVNLPINVMMTAELPDLPALSAAGVARVSYGPMPYLRSMEELHHVAQGILTRGH